MKPLFPQIKGLVHGGDYNPEQWLDRPDILAEDIRLMREAGMNSATLGMFSWSALEPREGEFELGWLVEIVDNLYQNGIYTVLGTPGARPAWLDAAYPEAMRVAPSGVRNHHGVRHNHCMSSPKYREKVEILIRKLVEALGNHPGVILWHISNELGGECWCDLCQQRFVEYLRGKFNNDIGALNKAWWTAFWSHSYNGFEQIEPPWPNGERSVHGLTLEWKRFTSWNMRDYMRFEANLMRSLTPHLPITTNFMRLYAGLDYHAMVDDLDVISWDSYPPWGNDTQTVYETAMDAAFDHAVIRGTKPGKPFMLMESTPSLVNWHPYNKLKRPGIHRLSSLQAVAQGSDTVQYFQWRKGRGSAEQFHGAVMDHLGRSDTRVFADVAEVGSLLRRISEVAGSLPHAKAALLFDWDTRWAIGDMNALSRERLQYDETCRAQYQIFHRRGIEMDVISPTADFSGYSVVVAPMLYMMKPGVADRLKAFVRAGGQLVATYLTGYVDENTLCFLGGFPGDGLGEVFGLYAEEIDTLYPTDRNAVLLDDAAKPLAVRDYCEIVKPQGCQVIGQYCDDFYAGTPAVTRNAYGEGSAWYVAARIDDEGMEEVYKAVWAAAGLAPKTLPKGIELAEREADGCCYTFYFNWLAEPQQVSIHPGGYDLISGGPAAPLLLLPSYGAAVVRYNRA